MNPSKEKIFELIKRLDDVRNEVYSLLRNPVFPIPRGTNIRADVDIWANAVLDSTHNLIHSLILRV